MHYQIVDITRQGTALHLMGLIKKKSSVFIDHNVVSHSAVQAKSHQPLALRMAR